VKLQQVSASCFAVVNEKNRVCDASSGHAKTFDAIHAVAKARGIEVEF